MTAVDHYNTALLEAKTKALAKLLAKLDGISDPKLLLAVLRLRPLPTPAAKPAARPAAQAETAPASTAPAPAPAPIDIAPRAQPSAAATPSAPAAPAPTLTRQQRRHLAREAAKLQRRQLLPTSERGPVLRTGSPG